jgi:RHS repeat-associated protein
MTGGRVVSLHDGASGRTSTAFTRTITTRDGTSLSEGLDTVHTLTLHDNGLDERTHTPPIGPSSSTRSWSESATPRPGDLQQERIAWSEASGASGASWSRTGSWDVSRTPSPLDRESRVDLRWGDNVAGALWVASTTRRQVTPEGVGSMVAATEVLDTTQLVAPATSEAPLADGLMTSPLTVSGVPQVSTTRMWRASTSVGWTIRETSPMGRFSTSQLDLDGRVTDTTPPVITQDGVALALHPTHVTYGSHGRIASVTRGARVVSYAYYGDSEAPARRGRVHTVTVGTTTSTDPTSVVTFSYDEGGVARSSRVSAPSGATVETAVDVHGNVTSITPPGRGAHGFAYGLRDRLSAYHPPPASGTSAAPWQTTYDAHVQGMARQVSRPDGDFDYGYDHGRLQSVTLPSISGASRPSVTYGYDEALGVVQTVTHTQNGVIEYGYNKATRGALPLSETWRITSGGVETSRSVSWTHDDLARVASWTVEGGPSLSVSYDGDGALSGVGAMSIERDATAGTEQGTTITSGGGTVATSQRYNAYGEVVARGSTYGSSTTGLSFAYAYDTFGRVRHVSESGEGAGEARWYGYDADGRLVSVCATATCSDGDGSTEREHYAYDANGNRTSWSNGAGSYSVPSSGGVDAQDRLLRFDLSGGGSVAYAYDNLGRTATRVRRDASDAITESTTLVYDSDGALRSFTRTGAEAVSVTYEQDAVGRRVARRVGGSVTARWLYRGIHPVAEYDGAWVLRRVFVYVTRGHVPDYVLAREGSAWVPYRVVTDHLGSVRRVVRVSDGAVVQRMRYDAYGRVLDDVIDEAWSALPFGYAGGLYDRDTGLVRFGARDYDAEIGRWTAKDPIGFSGGDSNVYVYVGNDPQERHDPSGLFGVNELASYLPGINLFAAGVRERANGIFEMGSEATVERGACRAQHGAAMIGLGAGAAGMFAMLAVGVVSMAVAPGTPAAIEFNAKDLGLMPQTRSSFAAVRMEFGQGGRLAHVSQGFLNGTFGASLRHGIPTLQDAARASGAEYLLIEFTTDNPSVAATAVRYYGFLRSEGTRGFWRVFNLAEQTVR